MGEGKEGMFLFEGSGKLLREIDEELVFQDGFVLTIQRTLRGGSRRRLVERPSRGASRVGLTRCREYTTRYNVITALLEVVQPSPNGRGAARNPAACAKNMTTHHQ